MNEIKKTQDEMKKLGEDVTDLKQRLLEVKVKKSK